MESGQYDKVYLKTIQGVLTYHIGTLAYRDDSLIGTILQWMLFFGKNTVNVMLEHTSAELFKYRKLFHS